MTSSSPDPATLTAASKAVKPLRFGLSSKLLLLTIGFVMLSEVFIFVPSIANYRNNWLKNKLDEASLVASALDTSRYDGKRVNPLMRDMLLEKLGAYELAIFQSGYRFVLAYRDIEPMGDVIVRPESLSAFHAIQQAFVTLFIQQDRMLNIQGQSDQNGIIELYLPEKLLRDDMLIYGRNILILSLIISLLTAICVYLTLTFLFIRPLRHLDETMSAFAQAPDSDRHIIQPSGRHDELGRTEEHLYIMQKQIAQTLGQQRRLAELGMAVSKINHDLRNLLATAQIFSDNLASLKDPMAKRLAPKIIRSIDRAVSFCEATLAYGRIKENAPRLETVFPYQIGEDVRDFAGLTHHSFIKFHNEIDPSHCVKADPEHLFRIFLNLTRNAKEALEHHAQQCEKANQLSYDIYLCSKKNPQGLSLTLYDNGPGIPSGQVKTLFKPFVQGTKPSSTGLGLAIVAELVSLHQWHIKLMDQKQGACFKIECF